MAVKSGKDSLSVARFRTALMNILAKSGQTREEFAQNLAIHYSTLTSVLNGSRPASIALMDEIAGKMHRELSDMLSEGRAIMGDDDGSQAQTKVDPPEFSPEQVQAIEAFKVCMKIGDDISKLLAKTAIDHAKQSQAGFDSHTKQKPLSKSA